MEFITLDLVPGKIQPVCNASQYDAGRQIGINVTENGTPFNLLASDLIIYSEKKPDGNIVTMDVAHDASTSFVFVTTEQMTAVTGSCICQFTLKRDGVKIGSLDFFLIVEADPTDHGVTSHSEINNLERQVSELVDGQIEEDLSHYYKKSETYSSEEIDNALDLKANASDVYDKTEIDTALALKANTSDVNTALALKADKATTYNKTEVDNLVSPKADKSYVDSELATKADQATTYSKTEVDALINALPTPMVFKGTLGTGGTITTLPSASAENEGYTYKVITDGTYQGIVCKVGDVVTSNGSDWVLIPSGDTDSDTWRAIKINGTEKLSNAISSGAVDFEQGDNITITFDADGNKIIVATTGIYTKAEVDALIAGKCDYPTETASGDIASFNTDLASALKECEVSFTAYQASGTTPTPSSPIPISGFSSAELFIRGINLCDEVFEVGDISASTGLNEPSTNVLRTKNYIPIKPDTQYFPYVGAQSGSTLRTRFYDKDKNFIGTTQKNGTSVSYNVAFTTPVNACYMRFTPQTSYGTTYNNNISINYPSTDTTYHAYSGTSVVIPFGDTYYGGVLDVIRGKLQATWGGKIYDGTETWKTEYTNNFYAQSGRGASSVSCYGAAKLKCSHCLSTNDTGNQEGPNCFISRSGNLNIQLPTAVVAHNTTDFKNWLATQYSNGTPLTIAYIFDTPIEIDLTPVQIATLVGDNNVFCDIPTSSVEVAFKVGIEKYINDLLNP